MSYTETIGSRTYRFADLKTLMAKASPQRSGDQLAGVAAAKRGGTRRRETGLGAGAVAQLPE
ncbi:MAG: Ethanolamine ammonia-lyase heavy chain (EC [uncultured Paraburkholderia sp.]|nr:MAG: Ethanolamine ammonia-lyase heavy chain (EC [uncultured Paraburkholderia sp.]